MEKDTGTVMHISKIHSIHYGGKWIAAGIVNGPGFLEETVLPEGAERTDSL